MHRFFIDQELSHDFWINDENLLRQWRKVLRLSTGSHVVIFNREKQVRMYKIDRVTDTGMHLELAADIKPQLPKREIYLVWSLLKNEHNDMVLQKCTELGVSHFMPVISERTVKTGFNIERANKIIIEAVEQCERGDIPTVYEPQDMVQAIDQIRHHVKILVALERADGSKALPQEDKIALVVGPEGGWSEKEKQWFSDEGFEAISLGGFILRGETASIAAATLLLQ